MYMKTQNKSLLQKAHDIVNNRSEENVRQYGPFIESMEKTARIASEMLGYKISAEACYIVFIAQKLSRESYGHKEDNILDACAYMSALNDYKNFMLTIKPKYEAEQNRKSKSSPGVKRQRKQ